MSVLDYPTVRSSAPRLDELEAVFLAWVHDPAMPDVVDLGDQRGMSMVELSRQLRGSQTPLDEAACVRIGVPTGVTFATAAAELLHATIAPDGPRCRSFRAASYYLRGLIRLDADLRPGETEPHAGVASPGRHSDVR